MGTKVEKASRSQKASFTKVQRMILNHLKGSWGISPSQSVPGMGAKRKLVGLAGCTAGRELRLTRELIELDGG